MKLIPKKGTDAIWFGLKPAEIENKLGKPAIDFKDDEGNTIYLYDQFKLRLTFYCDEEYRFSYLICSLPDLVLFDINPIGMKVDAVKQYLESYGFTSWEREVFDITTHDFNEANWLILQSEYGEITKIECGAIISNHDQFEWITR